MGYDDIRRRVNSYAIASFIRFHTLPDECRLAFVSCRGLPILLELLASDAAMADVSVARALTACLLNVSQLGTTCLLIYLAMSMCQQPELCVVVLYRAPR